MTNGVESATAVAQKLCAALEQVIRGRGDTVRLVVAALLADGHVLLEDYPGSGKTTLSKTLGRLISKTEGEGGSSNGILSFRRVQFTPDMLPGDVLGVNVFDAKRSEFRFIPGPIFAHVVLADEINRTGPKVQAAFLECMAEKQVTIDNVTHPLSELFFVIGTQNPLDIAGTYPLPLVQLDRFMIKIPMSYVDATTEFSILEQHEEITRSVSSIAPVCTVAEVLQARQATRSVVLKRSIRETIINIVQATRGNPLLQFGASTRAALMLQEAMKGWAVVQGRSYVTEDDLKAMAAPVLLHRLRFQGGARDQRSALLELITPHVERLVADAVRNS